MLFIRNLVEFFFSPFHTRCHFFLMNFSFFFSVPSPSSILLKSLLSLAILRLELKSYSSVSAIT